MHPSVGRTFTMSEVVALTGIAASTVRYYVATGLLPAAVRAAPNRHLYDERHVESLRLVKLLKERRNLSVAAIRVILPDLLELPADGAFRPEMWEQLVEASTRSSATTSPTARLVQAGVEAFTKHGYAEVRVDDVCRAAHLAKGSFYRHFSSKEELYFAVAAEVASLTERRFLEATASDAPGHLRAEEAAVLLAEAFEAHLALVVDLMALAAQRRPGHGRVLQEFLAAVTAAVALRLGPSSLHPEDVVARALVLGVRRVIASPLSGDVLGPVEGAL